MAEYQFKKISLINAEGKDAIYADMIKSFLEANITLLEANCNDAGLVKGSRMFDVLSHTLGCLIANIPWFLEDFKGGLSVADILTEIVEVALEAALQAYAEKKGVAN